MSSKRDKYNQIEKLQRRFYEQDFVILVVHLIETGRMNQVEIAKLLGIDSSVISKRISRYKQEQE